MRILTVKELSALIRITPQTLYQWPELNKIPCLKLNGALRFDYDEVLAWLQTCKNMSNMQNISHAESIANKPRKGGMRKNGHI